MLQAKGDMVPGASDIVTIPFTNCLYAELPIKGYTDTANYTCQKEPGFLFVAKVRAKSTYTYVDFKTEVKSDELRFSHIAGKLKTTSIPYTEEQFETELGDDVKNFTDNVNFKEINLSLGLKTVGAMRNLKISDALSVTGYRKSKSGTLYNPVKLVLNNQDPYNGSLIAGEPQTLNFNQDNSNLVKFLLNLPAVVKIGSTVVMQSNSDKPDSTQAISNSDMIHASVNIKSPMKIAVKNAGFTDTLEIDLTQNQRDDIKKGNEAEFVVAIENHIGLGAIVRASFVDDKYNTLFSVKSKVNNIDADYIDVKPAGVDANGAVSTPVTTTAFIILTKENIELFDKAKYVIADDKLRSSGYTSGSSEFGPFVKVRAKDYLLYKIYGRANYHVDTKGDN